MKKLLPLILIIIIFLNPSNILAQSASDTVNIYAVLNVIEITFRVYPEKRIPATNNWDTIADFELRDCATNATIKSYTNITVNPSGIGTIPIAPNDIIDPDNYRIAVTGYSHLTRNFNCYTINSTYPNIDLIVENKYLLAGDTAFPRDNAVTLSDLNETVSNLYLADYGSDLNQDGEVNSLDLSILSFNYSSIGD